VPYYNWISELVSITRIVVRELLFDHVFLMQKPPVCQITLVGAKKQ